MRRTIDHSLKIVNMFKAALAMLFRSGWADTWGLVASWSISS